jgi:K+-sensing histidine kinase KdpD
MGSEKEIKHERLKKNMDNYLKVYRVNKEGEKTYHKSSYNYKLYDKKLSEREKKRINANFAFRGKKIGTKEYLLFIILLITTCVLMMFLDDFEDPKLNTFYIILFFLWAVALVYDVNSKYYYMFLIIYFVFIFVTAYLYWSYETEALKIFDNKSNNKAGSNKKK